MPLLSRQSCWWNPTSSSPSSSSSCPLIWTHLNVSPVLTYHTCNFVALKVCRLDDLESLSAAFCVFPLHAVGGSAHRRLKSFTFPESVSWKYHNVCVLWLGCIEHEKASCNSAKPRWTKTIQLRITASTWQYKAWVSCCRMDWMSLPERVSTQCIVQLIGMVPGCVERLLSRSVPEQPSYKTQKLLRFSRL